MSRPRARSCLDSRGNRRRKGKRKKNRKANLSPDPSQRGRGSSHSNPSRPRPTSVRELGSKLNWSSDSDGNLYPPLSLEDQEVVARLVDALSDLEAE